MVKNSSAKAGDAGLIPGLEGLIEEEMAAHFGILSWEIPLTEEPGGLQSIGSQRVIVAELRPELNFLDSVQ